MRDDCQSQLLSQVRQTFLASCLSTGHSLHVTRLVTCCESQSSSCHDSHDSGLLLVKQPLNEMLVEATGSDPSGCWVSTLKQECLHGHHCLQNHSAGSWQLCVHRAALSLCHVPGTATLCGNWPEGHLRYTRYIRYITSSSWKHLTCVCCVVLGA